MISTNIFRNQWALLIELKPHQCCEVNPKLYHSLHGGEKKRMWEIQSEILNIISGLTLCLRLNNLYAVKQTQMACHTLQPRSVKTSRR